VTGHDERGVAKALIDDVAANSKSSPTGIVSTLVWSSDATPARIAVGERAEDMGARILGTAPPSRGSRFAVIDFPPRTSGRMHRTDTIDYVMMVEGELEMLLDDSSVTIAKGDVMVQRGTNHEWRNNGDVPARAAFVLLDAEPLAIGEPVQGLENAR
jgi:quercetin dioxygenase-like cupin family protein